jgi:hypothetical protein
MPPCACGTSLRIREITHDGTGPRLRSGIADHARQLARRTGGVTFVVAPIGLRLGG